MKETTAIVLAAGKGTRMKSDLPKVLFPVLGRPMVHWVLDALQNAGVDRKIAVVGYRAELVQEELGARSGIAFAIQSEQLGTGHAVKMCSEQLSHFEGSVIVVAGDSPLIQTSSIRELLAEFEKRGLDCLLGTLRKDDPQGLGRIVRDSDGQFERIVEEKDASPSERNINEVNMSMYLFRNEALQWALERLTNNNAQSEYYLTDTPRLLREGGFKVDAVSLLKACESLSINTVDELGMVEAKMQELGYPCVN